MPLMLIQAPDSDPATSSVQNTFASRGTESEPFDRLHIAIEPNVLPPDAADTGFNGHTLTARGGEDFIAVALGLIVEAAEAWHADHPDSRAQLLGCLQGHGNFRP